MNGNHYLSRSLSQKLLAKNDEEKIALKLLNEFAIKSKETAVNFIFIAAYWVGHDHNDP